MIDDRIAFIYGGRSHSASFDQRRRPETLRTAIATAFFWPTSTTSFLPRVTPVYSRFRCSRDDHGRILRTLAFVDGHGVGRHQRVEFAKSVGDGAAVKAGDEFAIVGIDVIDIADVTVINILCVVVLNLHHLFAGRESPPEALDLTLARGI